MTDEKPAPDDRYHPRRIQYAGRAPKGWDDDYRFTAYVRADIHDDVVRALREALEKIAAGDGYYGAQAREYKDIARAALRRITGEG